MTTAIRFCSVLLIGLSASLIGVGSHAEPSGDPQAPEAGRPSDAERFPIDIAAAEARAGERFAKIDADGDGRLTREELQSAEPMLGNRPWLGHRGGHAHGGEGPPDLPGAGLRGQRLTQMDPAIFKHLDSDGNGAISEHEFSMQRVHEAARTEVQNALFARLDANADGALTREEMPNPAHRLRRLDKDGDGLVSAEEAAGWRERRAHRRGNGA